MNLFNLKITNNTIWEITKFLLQSIIIVWLVSYSANVFSDKYSREIVSREIEYTQSLRKKYQGLWLIKIFIEESDYNPYKNLTTYHQGALSIDNNLKVTGNMYLTRDVSGGVEKSYVRENRRHSEISGSIIDDELQLTLHSDFFEKMSLEFLEGKVDNGQVYGDFVSEVANSRGKFCMIRLDKGSLGSNIDCNLK